MEKDEQIRSRLKELVKETVGDTSLLGTVKEVDSEEFTCVLYDEERDLEYPGVRLRPVVDGNEGNVLFPKVGTWALAIRVEDDEDWVVVSVGEIEKWRLSIDHAVIEQDSSGLLVKKNADTLRDALDLLIDAVSVIVILQGTSPDYAKLAQAKVKIDNILKNGS